jgi:hypothetical protein
MILALRLPRVGDRMQRGTVRRLIAHVGEALRPGTPLLEVRVDLDQDEAQDCPPLFFFRLIATERAFLRTLSIAPGDIVEAGGVLGVATTTPDELCGETAVRALRTTSVAIQVDPLAT